MTFFLDRERTGYNLLFDISWKKKESYLIYYEILISATVITINQWKRKTTIYQHFLIYVKKTTGRRVKLTPPPQGIFL